MSMSRRTLIRAGLMAGAASVTTAFRPRRTQGASADERTLKAVMHTTLSVFDPVWTTANITLYHAGMIYDNLFSMDANLKPQPQMVGRWSLSNDKKTYTFELRDGLGWHDGTPVTAADCVASIRRFAVAESAGQMMMQYVQDISRKDDRTFVIALKEPFGMLIDILGKLIPRSCFIMRKSDAEKPASEQVSANIGSGPFIFNQALARPGARFVYDRNPKYVPRSEPPSGLAGGKVVKVDRVIFETIADQQTAMAALQAGEIDFYEIPPIDLLAQLEADPKIKIEVLNKQGSICFLRMNWLHPPFSEQKARQALLYLMDQKAFMAASFGNPKYYGTSASLFANGNAMSNDENTDWFRHGVDLDKARQLLKESGYNGAPVVVLDPTNHPWIHNSALVAAAQLRKIGVNVQVAASDWGGLLNRRSNRETVDKGGWDIFITSDSSYSHGDPIACPTLAANGKDAWFGWPTNDQYEALRRKWAVVPMLAERQEIARQMQRLAWDFVPFVHAGVYFRPVAYRTNVRGFIGVPEIIPFWNVEKA